MSLEDLRQLEGQEIDKEAALCADAAEARANLLLRKETAMKVTCPDRCHLFFITVVRFVM